MIFFFLDLIPKAKTKYLEVFPTVPPPPGLRFRPWWRGCMGVAHWMVEQRCLGPGLTSNKPCARVWTILPEELPSGMWVELVRSFCREMHWKVAHQAPVRLAGTPPAGCLGDLPEAGCSASRNHWNHPLRWPWNLHEDKPHGVWPKAPEARREAGKSRSRKREASLSPSFVYMAHPSMTKQSKGGWVGTERQ